MINVSQWSPSTAGYTIDFTASTADIYDSSPPAFLSVNPVEYCDSTKITCRFTENIQCGSVHPEDFQIFSSSGTIHNVTSVTSESCELGAQYGIDFVISFEPKLALGDYLVNVNPHDEFSVLDNCGNQAVPGFFVFATESGYEISVDKDDVSCHNSTDGTIEATLPGSEGNVWYSFNNGAYAIGSGTYTNLSPGIYPIKAKTENNCVAETEVEILNPPQAFADGGADKEICSLPRYTFTGIPSPIGTGTWTASATQVTFANAHNVNTQANNIPYGTTTFTWTVNNGVCGIHTDVVLITRYNSFTYAGDDDGTCELTDFELQSNNPFPGTGTWTTTSTDIIFEDATNNNTFIHNITPGTHTLTWTTDNGPCGILSDNVVISNFALPSQAEIITNDLTFCESTTQLEAVQPLIGTGLWTTTNGGTFSPVSSTLSHVNNLAFGENKIVWNVSNGTCEPSSDTLTIFRETPPTTATLPADAGTCTTNYYMTANTPTVGQGLWTTENAALIGDPTSVSTAVNGLDVGANTFTWTISNGTCAPSSDQIIVTRYEEPSQAEIFNTEIDICSDTLVLIGNLPETGTGQWIALNSGLFDSANSPVTTVRNIPGGYRRFVWQISNGTCDATSDTLKIRRFMYPSAANAGADQIWCADSALVSGNFPSVGQGSWVSENLVIFDSSTELTTHVRDLDYGENKIVWQISNGTCPPETDTIYIYRDKEPTVADVKYQIYTCSDTIKIEANTPTIGTGTWISVGIATIDNSTQTTTIARNLDFGTHKIVWSISNGVCQASTDTLRVRRNHEPSQAIVGQDTTICDSVTIIKSVPPEFGNGSWTSLSAAEVLNRYENESEVRFLIAGANKFVREIENTGCASTFDTLIVFRYLNPSTPNAGQDEQICSNVSVLTTTAPTIGTLKWLSLGGGLIAQPNELTTTVSNLDTLQNQFVLEISNGVCLPKTDTVVVTYSDTMLPLPELYVLPEITAQCETTAAAPFANDNCAGRIEARTGNAVTYTEQGVYTISWNFTDNAGNTSIQTQSVYIDDTELPEIQCLNSISVYTDSVSNYQTYTVKETEFDPISMSDNCEVQSLTNNFNLNESLKSAEFEVGITEVEWTVSDKNGNLQTCLCEINVIYPELSVIVHQALSPNGNGKNDLLIVSGLDVYPNNTLTIFNRWGNKVFEASPYQNNWDGTVSVGAAEKLLPDGTYYYVLDIGTEKPLKGFIYLKK